MDWRTILWTLLALLIIPIVTHCGGEFGDQSDRIWSEPLKPTTGVPFNVFCSHEGYNIEQIRLGVSIFDNIQHLDNVETVRVNNTTVKHSVKPSPHLQSVGRRNVLEIQNREHNPYNFKLLVNFHQREKMQEISLFRQQIEVPKWTFKVAHINLQDQELCLRIDYDEPDLNLPVASKLSENFYANSVGYTEMR